MFSNKIVVILLSAFLLAGSVYLGVLTWNNSRVNNGEVKTPVVVDNPPTPPAPETEDNNPATTTAAQILTDSQIQWLASPVKLGDLKLVEYASTTDPTGLPAREYYRVATVKNGGEIINEFIQPQSPSGKLVIRFHKTAAGKYFLIDKNSEFKDYETMDGGLINKAALDLETNLNSLSAPAKVSINNLAFAKKEWSDKMPLNWSELKKIGETANGDFYKKLTPTDHNLAFAEYVLKLPDSTAVYYDLSLDFVAGDNSLIATFNNESQDFKTKRFNVLMNKGCSTPSAVISSGDLTGRLVSIGATKSGETLYTAKEADDELFRAVYDDYKIGRPDTVDYNGQPVLTFEEVAAKKPAVVWRDGLGDYHVFYDNNYSRLAECGKPVIYLYPETKTEVKVKVGAEVRLSEPDYGAGWKVTAYPDGKIINGGEVYENLYWEGLGHGSYPAIVKGRIVKQANLEAELRSDLAALGLNAKETADFLEFWLSRMPQNPYIRLTWLNTAEMNELAPLYISPKPDTLARVFLDFSGQDTAETNLAPQEFHGFKRAGFTAVEWGGLLVGGR